MGNGKGMYTGVREANVSEITDADIQNMKLNEPSTSAYVSARNDIKKIMELIKKEKIQTIDDLETWCYGGSWFNKTVTTGSTAVVQAMYGKRAWDQVNREHTLFSLLKKVAWTTSGWRVITPETSDDEQYTLEDGSIPAAEDPTFAQLKVTPSSIAKRATRTDIVDALSQLDDGVSMLEIAKWLDNRHQQIINKQLLAVNENAHNTNGLWSVDRLVASYAEIAFGDVANSAVIDANYLDVYGLDRDAGATWADAQVTGQAFGSGDRVLALSHLDEALRLVRTAGGRYTPGNLVIVTHPDTATRIDQLVASNQRYNDVMASVFIRGGRGGMENLGAEPRAGLEGGIQVATYRGVPMFEDIDAVQDTIGRIYILNLDYIFATVLMPTRFYKWGGPETTSSFNIEAMYRTVMQIVCTNFRKQGKVRDLKVV